MKYHYNFLIRLLLCFIPVSIFLFLFTKPTIYGTYTLLLNYNPLIAGEFLIIKNNIFEFVEACIVPYAYYFLFILCLLTKDISLKDRIKIIFFGFILIFTMNILRIYLLIVLAQEYGFELFHLIHMFFWKFLSGVYVALVWILLVKIYKVKSIPIYSDLKTLYKLATKKKRSNQY